MEVITMRTKEALCLRIQQLCDERNLTVNGLSARCGMTQSTLNNIVSGRNNSTTVSTVQKICDGLEMELPDFFNSDLFRNLEQEIY
jgi:DNA-binding Xre family transcriptional regulator